MFNGSSPIQFKSFEGSSIVVFVVWIVVCFFWIFINNPNLSYTVIAHSVTEKPHGAPAEKKFAAALFVKIFKF